MKKYKFMAFSILVLGLILIPSQKASAATYETWIERGTKLLCWSKSTISWTTNSTSITSTDTWQQKSGFLVNLEGISKLNKSTKLAHWYHSKTKLLVGAEVGGVTIGWDRDVIDEAYITRSGWSQWDPGI